MISFHFKIFVYFLIFKMFNIYIYIYIYKGVVYVCECMYVYEL